MHRMILSFLGLLFLSIAGGTATPALAHTPDFLMHRPYAIEKTCKHHRKHCKVRMIYAAGEHAGLAGPGSYWYRKSPGARKHGDFTLRSHAYKTHAHKHKVKHKHHGVKHRKAHRHACPKAGWAFSTTGLHFVAGIPRSERCIRSYDWQ